MGNHQITLRPVVDTDDHWSNIVLVSVDSPPTTARDRKDRGVRLALGYQYAGGGEEASRHQEHGDEPEACLGLNSCELRDVPTDPDGVEAGRGGVMVGASGGSVNLRRCQASTRSHEGAPSRYTAYCIYRPLVVCVQPRAPLYCSLCTRTVNAGTSRCNLS